MTQISPCKHLILASASPRRFELLQRVGISVTVFSSDVPELENHPGIPASDICLFNARAKTTAVLHFIKSHSASSSSNNEISREDSSLPVHLDPSSVLVLGADTVVVVNDRILGKPRDATQAIEMLELLSGTRHQVMTGVSLVDVGTGRFLERSVITEVEFRHLPKDLLLKYVNTREPYDKAGAYAIQGIGAMWVKRIHGSYTNVVGLPLAEAIEMIEVLGGPPPFSDTYDSQIEAVAMDLRSKPG